MCEHQVSKLELSAPILSKAGSKALVFWLVWHRHPFMDSFLHYEWTFGVLSTSCMYQCATRYSNAQGRNVSVCIVANK
jgi:hypothetical protein